MSYLRGWGLYSGVGFIRGSTVYQLIQSSLYCFYWFPVETEASYKIMSVGVFTRACEYYQGLFSATWRELGVRKMWEKWQARFLSILQVFPKTAHFFGNNFVCPFGSFGAILVNFHVAIIIESHLEFCGMTFFALFFYILKKTNSVFFCIFKKYFTSILRLASLKIFLLIF